MPAFAFSSPACPRKNCGVFLLSEPPQNDRVPVVDVASTSVQNAEALRAHRRLAQGLPCRWPRMDLRFPADAEGGESLSRNRHLPLAFRSSWTKSSWTTSHVARRKIFPCAQPA